MNYHKLITQFESGELKEPEFRHKEHLIIALWYLSTYDELDAILRIKLGIMKYNLIYGVKQTEERGYHETITMFFVRMTQNFLSQTERLIPFEQKAEIFVSAYPDLRSTLAKHYSHALLWSPRARRFWTEPDCEPILWETCLSTFGPASQ